MAHCTLTIGVISTEKDHLLTMMKLKLLEQGLHLVKNIHQLEETLILHKQASNMLS